MTFCLKFQIWIIDLPLSDSNTYNKGQIITNHNLNDLNCDNIKWRYQKSSLYNKIFLGYMF